MASDPDTFISEPSPKRLKALTRTPSSPAPLSSSKGKHKTDGCTSSPAAADSDLDCCGICFAEDGDKAIRGRIDSCDHYFCFVCIMEWAKVESCCPLCKRRFSSIHRPPKEGVFPTERIVKVPVRDQVYHIYGNATVGPPDPYSGVRCSVCDSVRDESLLLLCDLCDSASHTYCAGLGATVPEGDWFCSDCTLSKAEDSEADTDHNDQMRVRLSQPGPHSESFVSIRDIVRESREVERGFTVTTVLSQPNPLSTHNVCVRRTNLADTITEPDSGTTSTNLGARTLRRCRNVQVRIQAFRENWNSLRRGDLSFSPSLNVGRNRNERQSVVISHDRSSQQLASQSGSSCDKRLSRNSYDVDRAWKMMNAAKSMEQAHDRNSINHQTPKRFLRKVKNQTEEASASSFLVFSSDKPLVTRNFANGPLKHKPQIVAKHEQPVAMARKISKFGESYLSSQSQRDHELPFSRKFETSVRGDMCHGIDSEPLRKSSPAVSSDIFIEDDVPGCLISRSGSVTTTSKTSSAKLDSSSSSKTDFPNRKALAGKSCVGSEARDDPKSDIQVLVKLSLKLLAGDRKLEVKTFKEIARLATHSILAACGLEKPKPGIRSFPSSSICCHTDLGQQRRMSTLMPKCCRECFHVFVKDVVNSIIVERLGLA